MGAAGDRVGRLAARLVPAVLTALGVVIVTAGLLSYTDPATAGVAAVVPSSQGATPAAPSVSLALPSVAPSGDPGASPSPSPPGAIAVATRIVVPALRIDLPVVAGPPGYPYCDVAMYQTAAPFTQPGQNGPVYIFAHARDGMFGPIYNLTIVQGTPDRMVGMIVQVYTSDDRLYLYEITRVFPHQTDLGKPTSGTGEQLWLQTSEGPRGTPGKTQVLAMPLSVGPADPADAHPTPHPVVCG